MTPKRGPGRPPLAEGEETRVLYVRLPASEHSAIVKAAAARGEKAAEYARRELARAAKRDARRASE